MQNPAPAPRLPLEAADRPLYRPPARVGCSGVALVCVAALLAFVYFLQVVAPAMTERISAIPVPRALLGVLEGTANPTETVGVDITTTPEPEGSPTLAALAPPPTSPPLPATPVPTAGPATGPEYVMVGNTDGTGVWLRADPRSDGKRLVAMPDKTLLVVIGADTTVDGKVWRNVQQNKTNPQSGWVLAQYLLPASAP